MSRVFVWREYEGSLERVGSLANIDGDIRFSYDDSYEGQAISFSLPLAKEPASTRATACFFSALIPEGTARKEFARMLHASESEFSPFLERLNDESIGALLFSDTDEEPCRDAAYEAVESGFFDEMAVKPFETAIATMGKTRLSLSGAMAKVGLYKSEENGAWFYPLNGAASTHIVKAANSEQFPLETINEALCLGVAGRVGLPAAECSLLPVNAGEPLLAVRRYDRGFSNASREVSGMASPCRLHQEDFSQAAGVALKYEPTDGNYLSLIASVAGAACANGFGEANLVFEYTLFDYLMGNCDNHLKNYALLYDASWSTREVAPIYDVVSTVEYPSVYLEMGISFGGNRRIDQVSRFAIEQSAKMCGLPPKMASNALVELHDALAAAVASEADCIRQQGFLQVDPLAKAMLVGIDQRFKAVS